MLNLFQHLKKIKHKLNRHAEFPRVAKALAEAQFQYLTINKQLKSRLDGFIRTYITT